MVIPGVCVCERELGSFLRSEIRKGELAGKPTISLPDVLLVQVFAAFVLATGKSGECLGAAGGGVVKKRSMQGEKAAASSPPP